MGLLKDFKKLGTGIKEDVINPIGGFGGNVLDKLTGAEGAREAAKAQERALLRGQDIQQSQFQQALDVQQPFLQRGQQAFQSLADLTQQQIGQQPQALQAQTQVFQPGQQEQFSLQDILEQDPGFQFRLQQSQKAVERGAAARGGLLTPRTLQELQQQASGLASQETGAAFGRFQQQRGQDLARQQFGAQTQGQRFREQLAGQQQQFQQQQAPLARLQNLALGGQQLASRIGGQQIGQGQTLAEIQDQLGNVAASRQIAQGRAQGAPFQAVQSVLPLLPLLAGGPPGTTPAVQPQEITV